METQKPPCGISQERWDFLTTSPKLTPNQKTFLDSYLYNIDWSKVDTRSLVLELITTQVLRDPDAPKGGKYDIFCGHNRTLAYALKDAEIITQPGSGGILQVYHVDKEASGQ